MKRYLEHIKSKPPHERRQHAMQISAGIMALVFVAWISTIGLRFATAPQTEDGLPGQGDSSQLANIVSGQGMGQSQQNATLIVATSSQY